MFIDYSLFKIFHDMFLLKWKISSKCALGCWVFLHLCFDDDAPASKINKIVKWTYLFHTHKLDLKGSLFGVILSIFKPSILILWKRTLLVSGYNLISFSCFQYWSYIQFLILHYKPINSSFWIISQEDPCLYPSRIDALYFKWKHSPKFTYHACTSLHWA